LFSLDASLIDVSMKVFPWTNFNRKKSAFKLHLGLDHDGPIPAFAFNGWAAHSIELVQINIQPGSSWSGLLS